MRLKNDRIGKSAPYHKSNSSYEHIEVLLHILKSLKAFTQY